MNNEEILRNYERGLASSGKTRSLYIRFAGEFLDYAEGDFSREKISKYLENMRHKKNRDGTLKSDGTVNFAFRVVRTMFSRNNLDWPFRRGEAPNIREDNIQAPALHPLTTIKAIQAVKEGEYPAEAVSYTHLTLPTTPYV